MGSFSEQRLVIEHVGNIAYVPSAYVSSSIRVRQAETGEGWDGLRRRNRKEVQTKEPRVSEPKSFKVGVKTALERLRMTFTANGKREI